MIKKFFAWIAGLFSPIKIDDQKVDDYIAQQSNKRSVVESIDPKKVKVSIAGLEIGGFAEGTKIVVDKKEDAAPRKTLDEQLKEVELPAYAKGKVLPPKAKKQYIARAKSPVTSRSNLDNSSSSVTASPVNDPTGMFAAGVIMGSSASSSSSSYGSCSSYDSSSSHSSSSSSYDSGSYDSGSSSSSCD